MYTCRVGDTVFWKEDGEKKSGKVTALQLEGSMMLDGVELNASRENPIATVKMEDDTERMMFASLLGYEYDMSEMEEIVYVSEMRGTYPNIPLPTDIDLSQIENPAFVTLPLNKAGARSKNQRTYTEKSVKAMAEQINSKRPEGIFGHLDPAKAATEYASPDVRWLAAMIDDNGILWGKARLLTEKAQQHFKNAALDNARVATSLRGRATEQDGENILDLDLTNLDIVDPERAGLDVAVAYAHVTTEMQDPSAAGRSEGNPTSETDSGAAVEIANQAKETPMELLELLGNPANPEQRIAELVKAETRLEAVNAVLGNPDDAAKVIGEMKSAMDSASKTIAELTEKLGKNAGDLLDMQIEKLIGEMVEIEDFRPNVQEQLTNLRELGRVKDEETAKTAITKYLEMPSSKLIMESLIAKTSGGNVIVSLHGKTELPSDEALMSAGRAVVGRK